MGTIGKRMKGFSESWWPVIVIAVLVSLMVYQRYSYEGRFQEASPPLIGMGEHVPSLSLSSPDGNEVQIGWSGNKSTVLYVFQPDCIWCARNLDSFITLARGANRHRFVAISLTEAGLKEYLSAKNLGVPTYTTSHRQEVARILRLGVTPETIVVSPEGIVEAIWPGAYSGSTQREVEAFFGLTLPGLQADASIAPRTEQGQRGSETLTRRAPK